MPRASTKEASITVYSTGSEPSQICLAKTACPARQVGTPLLRANAYKLSVATSPPAHQTTEQKVFYRHLKRASFAQDSQTLQLLYQKTL